MSFYPYLHILIVLGKIRPINIYGVNFICNTCDSYIFFVMLEWGTKWVSSSMGDIENGSLVFPIF